MEAVKQAQVALGFGDILLDLGEEGFGGGKALFVSEAVEEAEFEGGVGGEVDGVEVEEVGFDGEGIGAEGGTVSDVGDGVEGFGGRFKARDWIRARRRGGGGADAKLGDVDAVSGKELGVGG